MVVVFRRHWFKLVVALLLAILIGAISWMLWWGTTRPAVGDPAPNFTMQDTSGKTVTLQNLGNKIKVVTFIYTNCPDACPLTVHSLVELQNSLKKQGIFGNKVELMAITMDPKRDTAQKLKEYGDEFGADFNGFFFLRGSQAETDRVMNAYNVPPINEADGSFTHSNECLIIDGNNNERTRYDLTNQDDISKMYADLKHLAAE